MARGPRKRSKAVTPVTAASAAATPATAAPVTAAPASASAASGATASVREGRARAVIDALSPVVDGGRFAAKRIAGEPVAVEAHCFTDGHDKLRVVLTWRPVTATATASANASEGREVEMKAASNDVWTAEFTPQLPGRYRYTVSAWVDHFESWRRELERRDDFADIRVALRVGAGLIGEAATRAEGGDAAILAQWAEQLRGAAGEADPAHDANSAADADVGALKAVALDAARASLMARYADRAMAVTTTLELTADRKRAAFSSWYELFPRSAAAVAGHHGTFRDVEARLPYLAGMGFDVLYFPPIHPIGRLNRKGTNNTLSADPGDVGSPWAIGAAEGGHKEILPQLGNLEEFRHLLERARELGIEIALDIAFQCAPDHPYVSAHPQWFKHRPDGSVQYAENPPKKYQDIFPFDFETEDWRALWAELKSIVDYWIAQGVKIFRVDNPHTKPFAFWEWLINEIKRAHPDVILLAEAFTRPKVMQRLAKLGFTQSYTYFTWRNTKRELTEYFSELALGPGRQYYRPNVWPNTPDILHETLQSGLRQVFAARLVLAATLAANYGIYGPTYELLDSAPREAGSEEYRDSEKYQLRHWALEQPDSLWSLIARMNRIRRDNAALQSDRGLHFCDIDNEQLIAYLKIDTVSGNVILTVVNLDPHHAQSGWIELDIGTLKLKADQPYQVHDLLSDQRYIWRGGRNYVRLDPARAPAHVFRLRRRMRSEQDFDYYM